MKGVSSWIAGLQTEEHGLDSPLATTRVYPDRGRGTFSPPDTLRDSMALFLQVSRLRSRACTGPPESWRQAFLDFDVSIPLVRLSLLRSHQIQDSTGAADACKGRLQPLEHINTCEGPLYQTVAFALQLEGAVDKKSPFKPAEVLQLHAERQPPANSGPPAESAPAGPKPDDTCAPRGGSSAKTGSTSPCFNKQVSEAVTLHSCDMTVSSQSS